MRRFRDTDELSLSLLEAQKPIRKKRNISFVGHAPTWREALMRKLEVRQALEGRTQRRKHKAAKEGQDLGAQRQARGSKK